MNLQELIKQKLPINFEQQQGLISMFTRSLPEEKKRTITEIIRNRMYSSFDGVRGVDRIQILETGVTFKAAKDQTKEIAAIRSAVFAKVLRGDK